MCRPDLIHYTEACGHYTFRRSPEDRPVEACPQATIRLGLFDLLEWSPCSTLICELEAQRKGRWNWTAIVDGVEIKVSCTSSGHCDNWKQKGYKQPNYKALAETEKKSRESNGPESQGNTSGSDTGVESIISNPTTIESSADTKIDF